jgi:hypothetical protein
MTFVGLALLLGIAVIVTIAMVVGSAAFMRTRTVPRLIRCPVTDHRVAVEFVQLVADGRLVDVRECSAFGPGETVTCDRQCIDNRQRAEAFPLPAAYI